MEGRQTHILEVRGSNPLSAISCEIRKRSVSAMLKDSKGRWVKGQSGNPKGRKRNKETLAEALRTEGSRTIRGVSVKKYVAKHLWSVARRGFFIYRGRKYEVRSVDEWLRVVTFIFERVDGKPTETLKIGNPEIEVTAEDMAAAMDELAEWKKHRAKKNS